MKVTDTGGPKSGGSGGGSGGGTTPIPKTRDYMMASGGYTGA